MFDAIFQKLFYSEYVTVHISNKDFLPSADQDIKLSSEVFLNSQKFISGSDFGLTYEETCTFFLKREERLSAELAECTGYCDAGINLAQHEIEFYYITTSGTKLIQRFEGFEDDLKLTYCGIEIPESRKTGFHAQVVEAFKLGVTADILYFWRNPHEVEDENWNELMQYWNSYADGSSILQNTSSLENKRKNNLRNTLTKLKEQVEKFQIPDITHQGEIEFNQQELNDLKSILRTAVFEINQLNEEERERAKSFV